ncbi:hypothetical protein BD779DRAFT_1511128 [Infundibulicybe gibba]|nr:hypothetical protein BD779DRAFT_1511128 [Infundibulicybe gibba]
MPKASSSASDSSGLLRRSARLTISRVLTKKALNETNGFITKKRRWESKPERSIVPGSASCGTGDSISTRKSQRITPTELLKREADLLRKERFCSEQVEELEQRLQSLAKQEDEASLRLSQIAEHEAKAAFRQLEEHFTCALCYEIMAHPYSLNPGPCGHTFCAICILKWFFSRLHRACGGWHEAVDCPICRSLLDITPDRTPRQETTFPFVPNRIAAAVCESLIEKLGALSDRTGSERDIPCGRKNGKSKKDDEVEEQDFNIWRDGGSAKTEWLKRDREGKEEMNSLWTSWARLRSHDFVALKQKLGV